MEKKSYRWGDLLDTDDPSKGKYFPVHIHQKRILDAGSNFRFIAAVAGTGGGKTVTGPLWIMHRIIESVEEYGRCLGMVIAPTYKVLSRATMPTLVETFKDTQFEGVYKESKSQYVLPNDLGVIWAQGADNPGGLEGGQFDFVWGDEGGQFKTKTFHAIEGRTGAKMAPILITTTPYGLGYLHDTWYTNWAAGDKNYFVETWSSHRNPAYPEEEYLRAKATLSPEKFKERYDGVFMRVEGRVYEDFHKCLVSATESDLKHLLTLPGKFYGGLDYGWNDPFCALNGKLIDDVLYVWYERYRSRRTLEQHADAMPKTANIFGEETMWYSDHNPEAIKKLRRGGFKVKKARKDIIAGILAVNRRIQTGKLKVIENRCPALVGEADRYRYPDKDEDIVGDKPVDEDNHAMDALRYMIMGIDYRKAA